MLVPTDPNVIEMYLKLYRDHPYRGLAELVLSVPELVTSFDKTLLELPSTQRHSVEFIQT